VLEEFTDNRFTNFYSDYHVGNSSRYFPSPLLGQSGEAAPSSPLSNTTTTQVDIVRVEEMNTEMH
jgi:hypothetical protein